MSQKTRLTAFLIIWIATTVIVAQGDKEEQGNLLIQAAREGDLDAVEKLVAAGADLEHEARFRITALWHATLKGHKKIALHLLEAGANPNVHDTVWQVTPLMVSRDEAVVRALMNAGADGELALRTAAYRGDRDRVELLLSAGKWKPRQLALASEHARLGGHDAIQEQLSNKLDGKLPTLRPPSVKQLELLTGHYRNAAENSIEIALREDQLEVRIHGGAVIRPLTVSGEVLQWGDNQLRFTVKYGKATAVTWQRGLDTRVYERQAIATASPARKAGEEDDGLDLDVAASDTWPSFRGPQARGIAAEQDLPVTWNLEDGTGIRWKALIPGLANASPVIWKERVFVVTAVSGAGDNSLKIGLYGDLDAVDDTSEHEWKLLCLASDDGTLLWERNLASGVPSVKRHTKSSQANSTPATNGTQVVTLLGEGMLCCHSMDGDLEWQTDLGTLDAGAFNDPEYQWGYGSSPVIYGDRVFVQCDLQEGSSVAAYSLEDASEVWKVERDEPPSWGSPTVYDGPEGRFLLTTGSGHARAYNPLNGEEIWRLGGHSAITVPTPFVAQGLAYIVDGYRPFQPIYAVRLAARGDITLKPGHRSSEDIAWSHDRGGSYLPSPLVYRGFLYICSNSGILGCYESQTGTLVYRRRFARGGDNSFTGSPVAADGKLYMTAESGVTYVVRSGPEFELLEMNRLGEYVLSTAAIAGKQLYFRTHRHLVAIGQDKAR